MVSGRRGQGIAQEHDRAGLGGQVAADSRKGKPNIRPGQCGGIVDAVATMATTRPSCRRCSIHSALPAGVSSNSTCLMWTFFATARAGAARSPVRIARSVSPRCFSSWITSCAARRTRSRAPITPKTWPSHTTIKRGLP